MIVGGANFPWFILCELFVLQTEAKTKDKEVPFGGASDRIGDD
jgi:hypothetical protein